MPDDPLDRYDALRQRRADAGMAGGELPTGRLLDDLAAALRAERGRPCPYVRGTTTLWCSLAEAGRDVPADGRPFDALHASEVEAIRNRVASGEGVASVAFDYGTTVHAVEVVVAEGRARAEHAVLCGALAEALADYPGLPTEFLQRIRPLLGELYGPPKPPSYRIAVRPYDDDAPDDDRADDIVVNDVEMFRMEQMDKRVWFACCYLAGEDPGNRIAFDIRYRHKSREVEVTVTEWPTGATYEGDDPEA